MKSEKKIYSRNILKSYAFRFLHHLHFIGGVLIPFFTIWGGISFFQIMILQAFFTLSMFLLEVPTGAIADRFGRKTSLILAGFVTSIAAFVYSSYPVFWMFMLGEFLWATGSALISGADSALLYDSLKEIKKEKESKKIFGRLESAGLLSLTISAPIGSLIAKYFGLRYSMMFISIPMLLAGIVAFSFKEPEISRKRIKKNYLETLIKGIKYFKGHKILKTMAFDYISISVLAFFLIWVYQVVLQDLKVPIVYFGFIHAAIALSEVVVLNNFNRFENLFGGKKRYILISALITGLSFILIAISRNVYFSVICILICSAFGLTRKPLFQNYMNKFIKSHNRATVLSTMAMLYSFSMAILDLLWGGLVDWNLRYTLIIIGSLIIMLSLMSKIEEKHLKD